MHQAICPCSSWSVSAQRSGRPALGQHGMQPMCLQSGNLCVHCGHRCPWLHMANGVTSGGSSRELASSAGSAFTLHQHTAVCSGSEPGEMMHGDIEGAIEGGTRQA